MKIINKNVVCVLKKSCDNSIILSFEEIVNSFEDSLTELKLFFNNIQKTRLEGYYFIQEHSKLKVLLNNLDYCEYLNQPNGKIDNDVKGKFNHPGFSKDELFKIIQKRAGAYSLEITYDKCLSNSDILAYSHRKMGWKFLLYELNKNFKIQFLTNFGYGESSFFYTKLRYKEIDIIPYSELIYYRFAELTEIIQYSAKHELKDESWEQAMKYGSEACNLFIKSEDSFVSKYIAGECVKLISGLNEIQSKSKFKLRRNNDRFNSVFDEIEFKGHDLVEFRGEKISGALSFVNSIYELKGIISIENYIDKIENYNKAIQPVLVKDMDLIKSELQTLSLKIEPVKVQLEQLKLQDIKYYHYRSQYKEEFKEEKLSLEKFDILFEKKYPDYLKFKDNYKVTSELYYELDSKISSLKKYLENMEKFNFTIEEYFFKKKIVAIGEI